MTIELPESALEGSQRKHQENQVTINILKDSTIEINNFQFKIREVDSILQQIKKDLPDIKLTIRADKDTNYQTVLDIINACHKNKFYQIAITKH